MDKKKIGWMAWYVFGCLPGVLIATDVLSIKAGLILALVEGSSAAAIYYLCKRRIARLDERANACNPGVWEVEVNGVRVGELDDARYARMQKVIMADGHTHLQQVANVGRMLWRLLQAIVFAVPVVAFWVIVSMALLSPESLQMAGNALLTASPEAITQTVVMGCGLLLFLGVLILGVALSTGSQGVGGMLGLRNCYRDEVKGMIRRDLGVPSDGRLDLYPQTPQSEHPA